MAETRRGFLAGLLLALVPVAAAQAARPDDLLAPAQYYPPPPPPRRRHYRRCWVERRRVMVRGRDGRLHPRIASRRVCRR